MFFVPRFMSAVLDRWPRIPEDRCTIPYPTMQLSTNSDMLNAPDVFTERLLQVRLARIGFSESWSSPGREQGYDMHFIEAKYMRWHTEFILTLPPAFSLEKSDQQWDELVPNMKKRRQILHLTIYALISNNHRLVLRLTKNEIQALPANEMKLAYQHRMRFVDNTLNLLNSLSEFHKLLGGSQTRIFVLSFYTFEAAMQLGMHMLSLSSIEDLYEDFHTASSSLLHPTVFDGHSGPLITDYWKKALCLQRISEAFERLRLLGEVSIIARIGVCKLSKMFAKIQSLYSEDTPSHSEIGNTGSTVDSMTYSPAEWMLNQVQDSQELFHSEWQNMDFAPTEWPVDLVGDMHGLEKDLSYQSGHFDNSFLNNNAPLSVSSQWPTILTVDDYQQPLQGFPDFISTVKESEDLADFLASAPALPQDPSRPF